MQLQPPGARHLRDSGPRGRAAFQEAGFRAEDARIESLVPSPLDAVLRFFRACDADGDGAVAAHCRTGRGRTAVVAALWLMREHGFTALEATVWLRLVRPGPAARPPHGPPLASPGPPCPGKAGGDQGTRTNSGSPVADGARPFSPNTPPLAIRGTDAENRGPP
jgi:hypothetical protein